MQLLNSRPVVFVITSLIAVTMALSMGATGAMPVHAAPVAQSHAHIDCSGATSFMCTDLAKPLSESVFGKYVGHDEPSNLFYSNIPGSGNHMVYTLQLPKDPQGTNAGPDRAFNWQLHPAFWFGMAMCDTQSYPEQVSTCTPDSDGNILDPSVSPNHAGTAFTELQFYPPAGVLRPNGFSCAPTQWCVALTIDSLSADPVHGTVLNPTCSAITGQEYVNFAFLTKNGKAQAPANPVQSTAATVTPDPNKALFMNSGDKLVVSLQDTPHGLLTDVLDLTTGQNGFMVASAQNTFGQVKFAPSPSTECTNIPFDFHPMYSTSSEQTRVIWAAHTYNIAFSDEIGHFDFCNGPIDTNGNCTGTEGAGNNIEPADGDDNGCFPANAPSVVKVSGCFGTNTGFDGLPYQPVWPDGNTRDHPTSLRFTSPLTGPGDRFNYSRAAFEADLPAIESTCNVQTGAGCTLIPTTDDGTPANFYPFYTVDQHIPGFCQWLLGNDIPGQTTNDFGKNQEYGALLSQSILLFGQGGAATNLFLNFRQIMPNNCRVGGQ